MLKRNHMKPRTKKTKGQSTVEYILLVAAVISVLVVFFKPKGVFVNTVNNVLRTGTSQMNTLAERMSISYPDGNKLKQ